jgi:hypothetical protein
MKVSFIGAHCISCSTYASAIQKADITASRLKQGFDEQKKNLP